MSLVRFFQIISLVLTSHMVSVFAAEFIGNHGSLKVENDIERNICHDIKGRPSPEEQEEANEYCKNVARRFLSHPMSKRIRRPSFYLVECSPLRLPRGSRTKYKCTFGSYTWRDKDKGRPATTRVDLQEYVTDRIFWSHRGFISGDADISTLVTQAALEVQEKIQMERQWSNVAMYATIGYRNAMEDRFMVYENAAGTQASFYAVFDGHFGEVAVRYARDVLMKNIINEIAAVRRYMDLKQASRSRNGSKSRFRFSIPLRKTRTRSSKRINSFPPKVKTETLVMCSPTNGCILYDQTRWLDRENYESVIKPSYEKYVEDGGVINYEKLLTDVFSSTDKAILKELWAQGNRGGTTALIAIMEGSQLIVANVGDSRGVMADHKGVPIPLSFDHRPDRKDEKERIIAGGGKVTIDYERRAWKVGRLSLTRTLGDVREKVDGHVIAEPEVLVFDLSEHRPQFIVLATDGLFDVINSDEVVDFIKKKIDDPYYGAQDLVRFAYLTGAGDNISVIVIKFGRGYEWPPNPRKSKSVKKIVSEMGRKVSRTYTGDGIHMDYI